MDEKTPKNLQAVLDWCAQHDPMWKAVVEAEKDKDYFIAIIKLGFEAGRQFQHDHPEEPMYPNTNYL